MWYMGLDNNNKPNGWDKIPWGNAIEVSDEIRTIHENYPEYIWNGTTLIPEEIPIPEEIIYIPQQVTMRQARLQLVALGIYDIVNQAVSSMGNLAIIEWEYAATIERTNPFVQAMIGMLGWTTEQADTYFIEADKL
jgi:hypothetical protein